MQFRTLTREDKVMSAGTIEQFGNTLKVKAESNGFLKYRYALIFSSQAVLVVLTYYASFLLRLDTDWYESTKHELTHLYPRLSRNGVLIIDDYGHWQGARQAVDEYFGESRITLLLNRVDGTARIAVKPG